VEILTPDQVDGLLTSTPFLGRLRNRAGVPGQCPKTRPEAQAREVMATLVAVDKGKQTGIGYRWRRARLAGAITAYLQANNETATTYLPEGS
jgi:hypothetical protein